MIDLDQLDLRTLQKECARAVATMEATNNNIYKFNKQAHHNSQNWYIEQHGDLPSRVGPGVAVKFVMDY